MSSPVITNPYAPIADAGCHLTVKHHNKKFTVRMWRGEELIGATFASRSGDCTPPEAERRARLGLWGPKSSFFATLVLLGEEAKKLSPTFEEPLGEELPRVPVLRGSRGG